MEHQLAKIFGKQSDYKICNDCEQINWYENETCHECCSEDLVYDKDLVAEWIDAEYTYWMEEQDWSEEEADNLLVEI